MLILPYFPVTFLLNPLGGCIFSSAVLCVFRTESKPMMITGFRLLYNHLEDWQDNNVYDNLNRDDDYLKALKQNGHFVANKCVLIYPKFKRSSLIRRFLPSMLRMHSTQWWCSAWQCRAVFPTDAFDQSHVTESKPEAPLL